MSFDILLESAPCDHFDVQALRGLLRLGGVQESFFSPVSYWGKHEYLGSWFASLCVGLEKRQHSVLVTSMLDPESSNFLMVWVLYYVGEFAHVQNHVVFLDEVGDGFDVSDVNSYVGPREVEDEDGDKISEWIVPLSDVFAFKDRLRVEWKSEDALSNQQGMDK